LIGERGKDEAYGVYRERCYKKNKQGINNTKKRKETIKDGEDGEDED
jgi:hypothetical protein